MSLASLLVGLAVLVAVLLHLGPTVQMLYGHDILVHLSGAYRILEGQIPHRDFTTDAATLTFFLLAAASPGPTVSVHAFVVMSAFLAAFLSLWCWALGLRRLHPGLAWLASVTTACLMAGTYNQGDASWVITYGMSYNRLGYALLYLVGLELLLRPPGAAPRLEFLGGLSTGFVIGALIFLKITYLAVALGFVGLRVLAVGLSRRWWAGAVVGAALFLVPMLAYLQVDLLTILGDQTRMVARRPVSGGYVHGSRLTSALQNTWYLVPCLFYLWYRLPAFREPQGRGVLSKPILGFWLLGASVASLGLMLTNYTETGLRDLPMAPFLAVLPMEYHLRYPGRGQALLLVVLLAISGPTVYRNLASLSTATRLKAEYGPHVGRFETEALRDLLVANASGVGNGEPGDVKFYAHKLNDGIELVRKHARPTDRIASLSFENPFPMALGLASPKGLQLCWHCGGNFDYQVYPPAEKTFADTTLVMVPTVRDPMSTEPLLKLYGDYLVEHFQIKDQTGLWVLLERKPTPGSLPGGKPDR